MTNEEFYGDAYASLEAARERLLALIGGYPDSGAEDVKAILYCCSRIKSPESMIKKLERRGLGTDREAALTEVYDAVGVRIICSFAEEVYKVVSWLKEQPGIRVMKEKDYIAYPKPNGYRSYHMLLQLGEGEGEGLFAEIQVRTIAIDFWAALEHQLKYKKDLAHEALIRDELKRCADEIASVDLSMQTIRDIIRGEENRSGQ